MSNFANVLKIMVMTAVWGGITPIFSSLALDAAHPSPPETKSQPAIPLKLAASPHDTPTNGMAVMTSVSQLSDVQPTDWAFQALQSLVERYGCVTGYPDGTFRGNRALTRYEFAAGLNACFDQLTEILQNGTPNFASREDLFTLQRLQEEFAAEIATLRGRVDALEARTNELETHPFSTTTKLYGLTFLNLTDVGISGTVKAEGSSAFVASRDQNGRPIQRRVNTDTEPTVSYLSWLSLVTSFTGQDTLLMVLAVGNGNPAINEFVSAGQAFNAGNPFPVQTAGPVANEIIVRDFHYSFPLNDNLRVTVGPHVNWFAHFDENTFSPYYLSGASSDNSINSPLVGNPARGAGFVVEWYPSPEFEVHAGYLVENEEFLPGVRTAADPKKGIFGRPNSLTAELTYKPSANANIRLLYTHNNLLDNGFGQVDVNPPIAGVLDDGPGGRSNGGLGGLTADVFGINFDWRVTPHFGLFGRYTYASANLQVKDDPDQSVNVQAFQGGLAFPDLGKPGALGTLSFLIPMDIITGRRFFVSGGGDGGTQYEIEANYYLPMTDHIVLVPAFYVIGNLNNFSDNPTVFVGHLRMQFSF